MKNVMDNNNGPFSTFSEFEENAINWFSSASSDQKFHFMLKLSGYMEDDELLRLVPKLREVNPPSPCMVPKTKAVSDKISPIGRRNLQAKLDEVKPSTSTNNTNRALTSEATPTNGSVGFATAGGKSIPISTTGMKRAETFIQSIENTGSSEKATTNGLEFAKQSASSHRTSPLQPTRVASEYEAAIDIATPAVDQKPPYLAARKPTSNIAPVPKSKPFKPPARLQPSKRNLVDSCESNLRKSPKLTSPPTEKRNQSLNLSISESQEILESSLALLDDDDDF